MSASRWARRGCIRAGVALFALAAVVLPSCRRSAPATLPQDVVAAPGVAREALTATERAGLQDRANQVARDLAGDPALAGVVVSALMPVYEDTQGHPIGAMARLSLPAAVPHVRLDLIRSRKGTPEAVPSDISNLRALDVILPLGGGAVRSISVAPLAADADDPGTVSRATPIDPADHQDAAFGGCDEVPGCAAAASTSPPGSSTTGPSATAAPTSTAAPSSSMPAAAAPQLARVHLPGDDNEFSPFDLRQPAAGAVDWPVTFVFRGNATVEAVQDGLCNRTAHAWRYCDSGGAMYLYATAAGPQSPFRGFLSSGGIKRFAEDCSSNEFTAHMRIYAPPAPEGAPSDGAGFTSATYGRFVVATVHLDFQDRSGCSGRIHGYADVAEQWFIAAMTSIPGWHVHPDQIDLGNANDAFVVLRDVGGVDVPHVYVNEQFATEVVID